MPRKTKSRSRKAPARKREPRARRSQSRRVFRQCLACGAEVDQMYGTGDTSWCPHCHELGMVFEGVGELPDPQMYGGWLLEQKESAAKTSSSAGRPPPLATPPPTNPWKGLDMKTRKLHTGAYCCPRCCFEFNLVAEDSLKCDECGGPLVSGSLEDQWEDEDNPND